MDEHDINKGTLLNSPPVGDGDESRGEVFLAALRSLRLPEGLRETNRARIRGAMERISSCRVESMPPRERRRAALLFGLAAGLAGVVFAGLICVAALHGSSERGPVNVVGANERSTPIVAVSVGTQGTESDGENGAAASSVLQSPETADKGLEIATASLTPTTTSSPGKAGPSVLSPGVSSGAKGSGAGSFTAPSPPIVTPTETPLPTLGAVGGLSLEGVVAGQEGVGKGEGTDAVPDSTGSPTPIPAELPTPGLPARNLCQAAGTVGEFGGAARLQAGL